MSEKLPQLFFMRHGAYTPSADPQNCTLSEAGILAQHQISQRLKHDGYLIDSILCSLYLELVKVPLYFLNTTL